MSTNFHWQTEDDSVWNDLAEPGRPYEPGQRSWITVVVLLIVLSVGGWIIGRQVQQRVETATADAEADILASHNLVRMAAAHGDAELFRTVLSGRSKNWMASHSKLVEAKLLFDRSAFGLTPLAQAEPLSLTDVNIELSPELQAAELRQVWPYAINRGQGVTETVQLEHITVYRRGATRWLLSPPEPEFWGTWRTLQGERVSLTYPARDEAIVRRLAPDLDNLLNDVCHRLNDAACPADLYLQLRLETDPASLLETAGLLAVAGGGYRLELPAPSLVGLPLDERGYQALLRGYGAYVAAAAITRLVDYDCCRDNIAQGLFYRALLDKQLSQLGLRPWPLTPAEYEQLLTRAAGQTFLAQDWLQRSLAPATATNWREVYSIVDFLLEEGHPETNLVAMQRQLSLAPSFRSWRNRFLEQDDDAFTRRWLAFVYSQTPSAQHDEPPLPWPQQSIQLVCGVDRQQVVYQYDLATETWSEAFAYDSATQSFPGIKPLPGGEGYVIEVRHVAPDRIASQLLLRRPGEEIVVFEDVIEQPPDLTSPPGMYFTGLADPTGRYLILSNYYRVAQEIDRYLLDLRNCDRESCELQPVAGWPVWSPDGSRTLIIEPRLTGDPAERWRAPLFLADERGQSPVAVATGHTPFWLDKELYGYVRQKETSSEIVVARVGEKSQRVLLQSADLLSVIPAGKRPEHLFITWVATNPIDSSVLLVYGLPSLERPRRHMLFLVERNAGGVAAVSLLFDTAKTMNPWFSRDGRWLTVVHFGNRGARNSETFLIDMETRQVRQSFTGTGFNIRPEAWSADARWFLRRHGEHAIFLSAPGHDYQKLIVHDFSNCSRLFWINN